MIELLIGIVAGSLPTFFLTRKYFPVVVFEERAVTDHKFCVLFHTNKGARARDAITNAKPKDGEAFEFFEGEIRRQLKESAN